MLNAEPPTHGSSEHDDIYGLLPWFVNGTLGDVDRQRVDAHLQACARCREDLRLEVHIHTELSTDDALAYMPAGSLKQLHARLDGLRPGGTSPVVVQGAIPPDPPWVARPVWKAASLAAVCLTLGFIAAQQWRESHRHADYYTVTMPAAPVPDAVIRAVFAPQLSIGELQRVLDAAQLSIIGGPSEAGVYSLASTADRDPAQALALLRAHPAVRFAELTRPMPDPPASP